MQKKDVEFLCNNKIIGRFYLRKCRFVKVATSFIAFKNDLIFSIKKNALNSLNNFNYIFINSLLLFTLICFIYLIYIITF